MQLWLSGSLAAFWQRWQSGCQQRSKQQQWSSTLTAASGLLQRALHYSVLHVSAVERKGIARGASSIWNQFSVTSCYLLNKRRAPFKFPPIKSIRSSNCLLTALRHTQLHFIQWVETCEAGGNTNPLVCLKEIKEKFSTYLSTCATVFGPYHWPMDFPSPTPIWAAWQEKNNLAKNFTYIVLLPSQDFYLMEKRSHLETLWSQQNLTSRVTVLLMEETSISSKIVKQISSQRGNTEVQMAVLPQEKNHS